jgi:enoyl-CoA hydratase/carnithine racemase
LSNSSIILSKRDGVATITLNRPEKLNAFDGEMVSALAQALDEVARESKPLRCVAVTGAGRAFCAGADLEFLATLRREERIDEFRSLLEVGRRVVMMLRETPIPIIAAVNGATAGGGGSIAMACDLRIASTAARFTQAFSKIGVHADFGASFLLPRLVGESKARELLFTAETITAAEAHRIGLVSHVVPPEHLNAATTALIETILSRAPLSLRLMKDSLARTTQAEFQRALDRELEAQLQCFQSEDFRRGIESFVQKTTPMFAGD